MGNRDESIKPLLQSGRHGTGCVEEDLDELIKRAIKRNIFTSLGGTLLLSWRTISNMEKTRKAQKLNCLYCIYYAKVVDAFVFLLSHRDSEQVGWNQTTTKSGKKGTNIPFDEDTQHRNNCIKPGIKNLGPNVTENAVQRLSHAESPPA